MTASFCKKVKQCHYRPGRVQRVPVSWGSQISRQSAHEGGKVVSLMHRPPLPPGNTPGTHFYYRLSRPQGHCAAGRIMNMKNSNDGFCLRLVIFICAAFSETWSSAQWFTASRTRDTRFLSSFTCWAPCTLVHDGTVLFTWTTLWILSPPCRRSVGPITDRRSRDDGVGGVDAGSPAIHRPRCHSHLLSVLNKVKYEVLEGTALDLMILALRVFSCTTKLN